jgi:integrase
MILTASRPSEALGARWEQIDFDKLLWTKPPELMKAGDEHVVPLSPAALEILKHQRSVRTGSAVFPGRGGSPISYVSFFGIPAKAGIAAATPHGWRSVFKDYCGYIAEDVSWELAEAALAHSLSSLEASYRHRTAVDKRRKVMADYADWLNGVGGVRVISLDERRKA